MFESVSRLAKMVFGDANEREIKRIRPIVSRINELEPKFEALDHAGLLAKTNELKERLAKGEPIDNVLPEAFANAREGAKRILGMRHYDVQLVGGVVLHSGRIAEMKTGEGKTLVGTSAVYLNALTQKGVHVVTVNDYLASRDAEWMGRLYKYLGMSVGVILSGERSDNVKRAAYAADITYGTNNEFGFDYLRDNMKDSLERYVQRGHNYAIVDEVDSILIDEARTPLIISGPADASVELYAIVDAMIPLLQVERDFVIDEKSKNVTLTDDGVTKVESRLGIDNLYDMQSQEILHHVMQSLKAHHVFKRDKDYVVRDGKVVIVDEFTGRLMHGRRWSDGLHQACEAKEKVKIEPESQVYATVTFQNYFRMYEKLAGMTGTAETEAAEFASIYKLDTVVIPTHRPVARKDFDDIVYKTRMEKLRAVLKDIQDCHQRGQPVLVGTTSVEKSEIVAELLKRAGVPHEVLNAKNHAREAHIVAQAGRKGAVTISTNMAGRGTDIRLGGNPEEMAKEFIDPATQPEEYAAAVEKFRVQCAAEAEVVKAAGGLHIIGTERHESRRIDNQLRGRAGRQGDPGSSRFYLSLEDDLLRLFGSDKITVWMERMGLKDDEPIEHRWITSSIENAQKKVEGHHFQMRKNLLEYDDVMNYQRKAVYDLRKKALVGDGILQMVDEALENVVTDIMDECVPEGVHPEHWQLTEARARLQRIFGITWPENDTQLRDFSRFELQDRMLRESREGLAERVGIVGEEGFAGFAREQLLKFTDQGWKDHLLAIERLRQGVGLRGYGQRNPLLEYKKEAFHMFLLMSAVRDESVLQQVFSTDPEQIAAASALKDRVRRLTQQQQLPEGFSLPGAPVARPRPELAPGFLPIPTPPAGTPPETPVQRLVTPPPEQPAPAPLAAESPTESEGPIAIPATPIPVAPMAPPPAMAAPSGPPRRPNAGAEARAFAVEYGLKRNDPCPCGSGQKYKKCCGASADEGSAASSPSDAAPS
jgi:preprotein translocase subunit SecA